MKFVLPILALAALPACMGGGSGSDIDLTPSAPSVSMNNDMGTILNNSRTAGFDPLTYQPQVGAIAQDHANDMFERNYLSVYELGSTNGTTPGEPRRDLGDDLNDAGLNWDQIEQYVAQGDKTVAVLFNEFSNRTIGGPIEGSIGQGIDDALELEEFEFFGIGKAGTGADTKFTLLLVQPRPYWSER